MKLAKNCSKKMDFNCFYSADDDDDREENLGLSEANVDGAGEGIGVCRTTPWTTYSPCSVTCGIGISMRTRTFVDHAGRKKCPHITIVEKNKCMQPECSADDIEIPDPNCPVTQWSDWYIKDGDDII